jgi:hypothetical protein
MMHGLEPVSIMDKKQEAEAIVGQREHDQWS